ncbi:hypothetical protein AYK26_01275 [Euryarchaeota archaeon SM23-78]|nr:MAG: hypothetical protein AYK26_01275 [Euryarchaeota archaeon SM23-78]MBW3000636.1 NAD-dependent epimerase/dehydratase family protein [Candidatus Woesearchaeota archaeon]
MKILITGSSGFIGRNLKKALAKRFGESELVALKRKGKLSDNEHLINYNDRQTLLDCKACENVDYVFHLAGITRGISEKEFFQANVLPTKNLLEVLSRKSPRLKRFIFSSSHAAAGPSRNMYHRKKESEEANPVEHYGQSKLQAENVVKEYEQILPYTIVRPGGVYGPGDKDFLGIFKMAKSGINFYFGNKDKYISLIYVDNLVESMISASLSEKTISKTYFLCNDEPVTWQNIHETIFKICGKERLTLNIPYKVLYFISNLGNIYSYSTKKTPLLNVQKVRLSKPKYWIASNENAKKDFEYKDTISLEEGVRLTYEYYSRNNYL